LGKTNSAVNNNIVLDATSISRSIQSMETTIGTDISYAASLLNNGHLVAVPTETVYGLAGNALNNQSVAAIYEAKNRPQFNPLIMHIPSIEMIEKYAIASDKAMQLASHFMPGPFTLLLPKKNTVPDLVTAGSNKVAVRIPNHPLTRTLLQRIAFPLAAPSANPFGYVSPVTAHHVMEGLQGKISYILDGGKCTVGIESTIVEVVDEQIIIHRSGGLAIEEIEQVAGKKPSYTPSHLQPQTPGQLKSHYATHTPLYVGDITELIQQFKELKIAIISLHQYYDFVDQQHQYLLSSTGNLQDAAANLFSTMRLVDQLKYDVILAEYLPRTGLGLAINDRLERARHIMKLH
jgi:L-threonylcarbamoyladenylate synthase